MRTEGIELLNEKRGSEKVAFSDVADHLSDYAGRFPNEAGVVDKVARFLAGVEEVDHSHEAGEEIGSDA